MSENRAEIEQACAAERAETLFAIENDPNHPATAHLRAEIVRLNEALEQGTRERDETRAVAGGISGTAMRPTLYTRHPDGFRSIDGATFVPCGSGDE